jgi:outer membrane protein
MLRQAPVRLILTAASAAIFVSAAAAQSKVAVVNLQQAVLQTAEIKKASADLEAKFKPRQAELQKLQTELDSIQQQLQAGQGKLSPQAEADLNARGQRTQRDLQRRSQDLQEEVDAVRNEILGKSGQKMAEVVRKLAEERGVDVVVDAQSTLYVKPVLDLTKDAIAEFDKAYPAK